MLNKKEIASLKKVAHTLKPIFQIGKNGLNDDMINSISEALEKRELIKISILQTCGVDKNELAFDIARLTRSEVVQVIGKTIVIYRRSINNPVIIF